MKIIFVVFASIIFLAGCANEKYFAGNGFEALAYQEHHEFEFTIKDSKQFQSQFLQLVEAISSEDKEASYRVEYKTNTHQKLVDKVFTRYRSNNVMPLTVEFVKNQKLEGDLQVVVAIRRFSHQTCSPLEIRTDLGQPDCFVESMRLKQVAYKSRVVGE
ncbi:hypothetical protein [Vibrio agarivorans]|uniref:hypothetical protein n=1 Tax=Vibrio agarivorans TaxID=153622 RepID=UPI002231E9A9|nr:hypothetical protein [Vibrio agarivorans]